MSRLVDMASVIRTKNAGPYTITCDVIFRNFDDYKRAKELDAFSRAAIAKLYAVPEERVQSVVFFDEGKAVKINLKRAVVSGGVGDTDVLGAQQHAPLLEMIIP